MTDRAAFYTWGWHRAEGDSGGIPILHVSYDHPLVGRATFYADVPAWRRTDRRAHHLDDVRRAVPREIAAHALDRDPTRHEIAQVWRLTKDAHTQPGHEPHTVDAAAIRDALDITDEEIPPMTETATQTTPATGDELLHLPLDALIEAPDNPGGHRMDIDDEMVETMRSVGVVEPLIVTAGGLGDGEYLIVAGHRRKAHAAKAGLTTVPCVVRHYTEAERVMAMIVENLHRKDLDPIQEARLFERLTGLGLSQRQIADKVGRQQSHVSKRLKLLKLPDQLQERLVAGNEITLEQGMALAELPDASLKRVLTEEAAGDLGYALQSEQRRLESAAKRKKLADALTKRGVLVESKPKEGWGFITSDWSGKGKEPDGHDNCIAAVVTAGEWSTDVRWYCTQPDSHAPAAPPEQGQAGDIIDQVDAELTETQRDQLAGQNARQAILDARNEAAGRRRAVIASIVAGAKPAKLLDDIALLLVDALTGDAATSLTFDLLDVEGGDDQLRAAAMLNPFKALTALAFSLVDGQAPEHHHTIANHELDLYPELRRFYELLQAHGYELTDEETKALAGDDDAAAA